MICSRNFSLLIKMSQNIIISQQSIVHFLNRFVILTLKDVIRSARFFYRFCFRDLFFFFFFLRQPSLFPFASALFSLSPLDSTVVSRITISEPPLFDTYILFTDTSRHLSILEQSGSADETTYYRFSLLSRCIGCLIFSVQVSKSDTRP